VCYYTQRFSFYFNLRHKGIPFVSQRIPLIKRHHNKVVLIFSAFQWTIVSIECVVNTNKNYLWQNAFYSDRDEGRDMNLSHATIAKKTNENNLQQMALWRQGSFLASLIVLLNGFSRGVDADWLGLCLRLLFEISVLSC